MRDPDTSSRDAMELSSFRLRNKVGGSGQDSGSLQDGINKDSPASEKGPFDSKPSAEKDNIKLGDQAKNKLLPSARTPNRPPSKINVAPQQPSPKNPMPGSATNRSSQMSSVRLINEAEFEGVFRDFKKNRITG